MAVYLDSSALVKLVVREAESAAFGAEMEGIVTYDARMRDASELLGFRVFMPM